MQAKSKGRKQLYPTVPDWLSNQNQSTVSMPEPALQGLSLALEGDVCMDCQALGGVQSRAGVREREDCALIPKLFPSCLHRIRVLAEGVGVRKGLQEESKRVVRRKTRPG